MQTYTKSIFLLLLVSFCLSQQSGTEEPASSPKHFIYDGLSENMILEIMTEEEIALLEVENNRHERESEVERAASDKVPATPEEMEKDLQRIFEEEYGLGKDLTPYRLRIGDRLYISIYGEPDTGRIATVDYTGKINYLLVDDIFVLGKSIEELRYELNNSIRKYYKHAVIAITPVEFGSQFYTILGEVNSPGKKLIFGKSRILSAIAEAGGLREGAFRSQTVELADLSHAFLARDGDYIPVDFKKLLVEGDMRENIEIASGDYIYIPNSLYKEIYVLGEVKSPTTFGFINTVSLVEAIAQGRGLTDRASSRICVIRGSLSQPKKFLIDINLILRGLEPDFLLQPGDIVYAPPRRFTSLREVVHEGVRAFIGSLFDVAGNNQFVRMTPAAINEGITEVTPVEVAIPTVTPIQ